MSHISRGIPIFSGKAIFNINFLLKTVSNKRVEREYNCLPCTHYSALTLNIFPNLNVKDFNPSII